jgi:uroporphyrinogen-III synthase
LTRHPQIKLASIGPETSRTIGAIGLNVDLEAREHNIEGLVKALVKDI